jgi:tetratricopeptide (TPR) repeat protein
MQLAEITPIKSVLRTSLSVALQQNTDDVILPIMKGSDKQPFPNEIKEVSRYIKYIGKEYPKDSLITNKLKAKLLFLDAYNILYSNSFEKYDSAVIYLNEILQFEPNASYPYNGLNLVYKKKNELEKAKNASTVAVNSSPKWTEPKAGLGKVYLKAGKYSLAIDEFNKIIKLNPEISKGYVNLADVQTTLGNYVEAEKLLDKAVKVDSLNPYIYSKIGHLNFLRGRFDDAEDFFNLSLRLDSANELAHNYLGKLNAEKYICFSNKIHYLKKSHYHYEKALKTNPSPENIVNYAKICLTSIEYVGYTEFYNQICENKRGFDSKEGTYNTLNLLLNKALNQNPYLEDAFLTLALNDLILKSDAKSGESNLIKAVKLCKQFPVSSYNYGIYLELLTNQTGAAAKFEESLKTDAKYFPAYIELFQIYGKLDMDKKLDELYQRALKNFENCALINYHYSLALFDLKQYDKAKKYSQQSVSEDTMNAEAYTTLQNMLKINRIRGLGRTNISNKYSKEIQANYQYIKIIDNKILVSVDSVEYVAEITGRIKTPYFYEPLGTFNDKYVLVQTFTGKKGLTDTDKKIIVNPEFEEINFIEGTTILVTQNNKMGCFNTSGEVVVPLIYWKITDGTYDGKRCICGRKYQNSEKRDFYDYSGNVLAKDM